MPATELPVVIDTYLRTHDARDTEGSIACFDADATVIDEERDFTGLARIRWWLDNAAAEFTFTRTLIDVDQPEPGVYIVTNHLSGNFPGGEVDLRYRVDLRAGLIHRLEIAP
ncbi:MAG TPA: hypothetical protein VGM78_12965 [Ilumatobacteraceae bacterium]|jgi:hypothetical protein